MKLTAFTASVVLVGAATLTGLSGSPAQAAVNCNWTPGNGGLQSGYGYFTDKYNGYNFYKGPASSCATTGQTVPKWTDFSIGCEWRASSTSAMWYYVIDRDSGKKGWVSGGNIVVQRIDGTWC
ncbi:hypothetical protein ABT127_30630 [Streptomyces sp. NPDC001904]|uniref:hypothetical protein n=1 Tax=Streptomyces sp. NPDC001904 TaxID=3154531 RepID=UPI00331B5B90